MCCSDGNHCCPTDYRCNEQETSCVKGEVVIPWYTKLPATTNLQADLGSVQCPDQSQCPEHSTCCQLSSGQWGCCPLPNVSIVCVCVCVCVCVESRAQPMYGVDDIIGQYQTIADMYESALMLSTFFCVFKKLFFKECLLYTYVYDSRIFLLPYRHLPQKSLICR